MSEQNKGRLGWLDIGKGIAMLFIMMSHTVWVPDIYCHFFKPIYLSFFFCASGYVFSLGKDFSSFAKNKVRTLLLPWFTLSMISIFSSQVISTGNHTLKADLIGTLLQIRGQNDYMWFIACLFLAEFIFYFIVKYVNTRYRICVYLFGLAYSIVLYRCGVSPLPWHIQTMGVSIFFLGLGYEFKIHENQIKPYINTKMLTVSSIAYFAFMLLKRYILGDKYIIKINEYDSNALVWTVGSLLALWLFLQVIQKIEHDKVLEFIGRNTLVYFAFQFKFQRIFEIIVNKIKMVNWPFSTWYISAISVIFEACCLAVVAVIFNRYLYFLLGKSTSSKSRKY